MRRFFVILAVGMILMVSGMSAHALLLTLGPKPTDTDMIGWQYKWVFADGWSDATIYTQAVPPFTASGVAAVDALAQTPPINPANYGGVQEDAWAILRIGEIIASTIIPDIANPGKFKTGSSASIWQSGKVGPNGPERFQALAYGIVDIFWEDTNPVSLSHEDSAGYADPDGAGPLGNGIYIDAYVTYGADTFLANAEALGPTGRTTFNTMTGVGIGGVGSTPVVRGVAVAGEVEPAGSGGGLASEYHGAGIRVPTVFIQNTGFGSVAPGFGPAADEAFWNSNLPADNWLSLGFPTGFTGATGNTVDFEVDITNQAGSGDWTTRVSGQAIFYQPIPEPGTLALVGIGILSFVGITARRRKRRQT
jgi:hypothetical protein